MSKAVSSDARSTRKMHSATPVDGAPPSPTFKPPLKPRRRLFYVLLGVFGAWITLLFSLYFVTVFPHRGEPPPHTPVEPNSGMTVPR